ncbi:MAG: DUF4145 domain-containing protein [Actinomycetota bacterium]
MASVILTECRACEAVVSADALARYSAVSDNLRTTERVTFARCPRCNSPLLIGEELVSNDAGREQWSEPYRMYPARDELFRPRLPHVVASAHAEACDCFRARAYGAAMLMCARTIESACIEHQVQASNLASAIAEMKSQGIIETRLHEWAETLPFLDRPSDASREDARDALEFTDAFLAYLYSYRHRMHSFRARRSSKNAERHTLQTETTATLTAVAAGAATPPPHGERSNGERSPA